MKWSDLRDASKLPPKAASGQIVWTPPTVQQEAHFLSTLDPLRHSPHQVAEGAQSREVCGKQQTPAAETICRLANCFLTVLLENQMVQRPHEQNRVECRGRHRMEVSCVSHDKLHLSMQSRRLEPELTLVQQGDRKSTRLNSSHT